MMFTYDFSDCIIDVDNESGLKTLQSLLELGPKRVSQIHIAGQTSESINAANKIIKKSGAFITIDDQMSKVAIDYHKTTIHSKDAEKPKLLSFLEYDPKFNHLEEYKAIGTLSFKAAPPDCEFNIFTHQVIVHAKDFDALKQYGMASFKQTVHHIQVICKRDSFNLFEEICKKAVKRYPKLQSISLKYLNYNYDHTINDIFSHTKLLNSISIVQSEKSIKDSFFIKSDLAVLMVCDNTTSRYFSCKDVCIQAGQVKEIGNYLIIYSFHSLELSLVSEQFG